ncbi:50S ribosomal protein L3 [Tuwongella immobilis]|uniref:Large ribosomal subunit protein uL3 n=1 Tax=Tuwongella immobilis TaxID=692036 RepID=A0A6C2YLR9_9BACT|nr:50S ribosomal protein L3 [Tuwongella immobilis]VIP02261.1 50s ribosomal protein l3 : 50S ribosomal protein L3 OS=Planctomyces maris DSM 8797 GN=rplC PE=3 SV=1: Ribosomal_L3 [Tuwongella immobilis]VTS00870.1 50s ribosomal protein l3 : 50S ribosomal protein L3 OS=Planctomyces maris DSM 8797 GN=rplC PE=3 SV=1: Ribosomal_L3 [Tuwongella immobilis]
MPLGLIGTKVGMTQVYDENGVVSPVTVLQLGPCPVLQVKDKTPQPNQKRADGYFAIQIGYGAKSRKRASRAERGHVAADLASKRRSAGQPITPKANIEPPKVVREFRLDASPTQKVGDVLAVDSVFTNIAAVDVIGTSKGRGFTGAMKRHNFQGMPAAHGAKKVHRQHGGTGSLASNRGTGRMKKGKKMAGRYGASQVTIRNLTVVKIDKENNVLLVRGGVPGPNGGVVLVRPTNKK